MEERYEELASKKVLTPSERVEFLEMNIAYGEETYGEMYTEFRSEQARFGDGPPGSQSRLSHVAQLLRDDRAALARAKAVLANQR